MTREALTQTQNSGLDSATHAPNYRATPQHFPLPACRSLTSLTGKTLVSNRKGTTPHPSPPTVAGFFMPTGNDSNQHTYYHFHPKVIARTPKMTAELTAKWQTIAEAYPYAKTAIEKSSVPGDGMPHAPSYTLKTPVDLTALSWVEMTGRLAAKWGHTTHTMPGSVTELYNNLGPADQLDLQTDTWTIHNGAHQWLPAHIQTARLTIEQCAGIHCNSMEELALALNALGKPTPPATLRKWKERGHLTKTQHGYPLTQALERIGS